MLAENVTLPLAGICVVVHEYLSDAVVVKATPCTDNAAFVPATLKLLVVSGVVDTEVVREKISGVPLASSELIGSDVMLIADRNCRDSRDSIEES